MTTDTTQRTTLATPRTRPRRLLLLFALTVLVRCVYFFTQVASQPEWTRAAMPRNGYLAIAQHLVHGQGYTTRHLLTYYAVDHLVPTAARSPAPVLMFAAVVGAVGPHWYYPILILAWCLSGVVAVAAYLVAVRATNREWFGLWTAIVFAFYLSEMFITTTYAVASEPLFTACFGLYLLLLLRAVDRESLGLIALSGLMLGLATLSRPTVLWLPVVSLAWILYKLRARGLTMCIVFVLTCVATQVPWVIRNYRTFGQPIVTTTLGGFVLYRHNSMIEEGRYTAGYSHPEVESKIRRLTAAAGRPLESYAEPELNTLLYGEAKRIIEKYPVRYLKLSALRTIWIWYNENSGRGLYAVENAIIYLLALIGAFYALRSREPVFVLLLAHIAYFVAIHSAINVQYRFICPIMPYMILLAGLPVYAWRMRRQAA